MIAERERSGRVGDGAEDREQPEHKDRPAAAIDEVEPAGDREGDRDADRRLHLPMGDEPGLRHPERADPMLVRTALMVEVVVGQVGEDLEQESDQRATSAVGRWKPPS